MAKYKYLITLWSAWYGYHDNILQEFSIEHQASKLSEADQRLNTIVKERVNAGLKEVEDFAIMKDALEKKLVSADVNKNNKVVRRVQRKIGDGGGHNFIYYNFELIQVPAKAKIDEGLFNLENCQREVSSFFKNRYQQAKEKPPKEKRFIGARELSKSKLKLSSFSWFRK